MTRLLSSFLRSLSDTLRTRALEALQKRRLRKMLKRVGSIQMTNLLKLPTWADKRRVYAVVETPRGSHAKLEFDPKLKVFTLSKPLLAGLTLPL